MTTPRRSSRILLIPAIVVTATVCAAGQAHAQVQVGPVHIMKPRDASTAVTSGVSNLIDHGGPVLANSTTYALWWGDPSAFPPDAQARIDSLLQGFEGSDYLAIANQYLRGATAHTHFGGNFYMSNNKAPPAKYVSDRQIGGELGSALNSFFAATKQAPDPSGIYFVFTSNFPVSAPFCAFHAYLVQSPALNVPITQIAYVPNTTNVFACDPTKVDPFFEPNSDSQGTQAMATLVAHEFMETITDPLGNAWYGGFDEIGDRCTWLFQSAVPLTDGSRRKVQAEWSNQVNGCDQGAGLKVQVLGAVGAVSKSGTLTTFSSPGGNYGTFGVGINKTGTVVGNSPVDDFSNFGVIGTLAFVRDVSGVLTTFDAPGATGATYANDINSTGTITGGFYDATGPVHGFTRNPNGTFMTFDVSTAGTLSTAGHSINDQGAIAGNYSASGLYHGFLRDPSGNITTFDAPGSIGTGTTGTRSYSINGVGAIAGYYSDANGVNHGFVRDPYGTISAIDAPGAGTAAGQGTIAQSINGFGAIAGYYTDANNVNHGFVRNLYGGITAFDAPGAVYGTFVYSINAAGAVAGYYSDSNGLPHAFVRDASGNFPTPKAPGSTHGSVAKSINDQGTITGYVTEPAK